MLPVVEQSGIAPDHLFYRTGQGLTVSIGSHDAEQLRLAFVSRVAHCNVFNTPQGAGRPLPWAGQVLVFDERDVIAELESTTITAANKASRCKAPPSKNNLRVHWNRQS
jgi:hypothetical protein